MRKQLFLLHFAGGNCYSYQFLIPHLTQHFDCFPLELPGRGKRIREQLIKDREAAVADYVSQIKALNNGEPYVIYGHSMGATLGIEIASILSEMGNPPEKLVVSGNPGPGVSDPKMRYIMDDSSLKEELLSLGGVPVEVLENEDLFGFYKPIIMADFEVIEKKNASFTTCNLSQTPIIAAMGEEEDDVAKIDNWSRFTQATFQSKIFAGNHFFILDHPTSLANLIIQSKQ